MWMCTGDLSSIPSGGFACPFIELELGSISRPRAICWNYFHSPPPSPPEVASTAPL